MQEAGAARLADTPDAAAEAARYAVPAPIHADDFLFRHHLDVDRAPDPQAGLSRVTRYYFEDGDRSAQRLHALLAQLHPEAAQRRLSLLEFASGYGCVSRHLARMGDAYQLVACDIHDQAVTFLQDALGIEAIGSVSDPDLFRSSRRFDVVFALSFFSHMPPSSFARWLRALHGALADGGLLVFTTHGRVGHGKVDRPALQPEGYWFAPLSEQKDLPTSDYGCMIATPDYVLAQLAALDQAGLVLFEEASWWRTQDLFVVRRTDAAFGPAGAVASDPAPDPAPDPVAAAIAEIHRSTSWRVTAPLRALKTRLSRAGRD